MGNVQIETKHLYTGNLWVNDMKCQICGKDTQNTIYLGGMALPVCEEDEDKMKDEQMVVI